MADDQLDTGTTDAELATQQDQSLAQEASTPEAAAESPVETPTYVTKEELDRREAELIRRLNQSGKDRAKQINAQLTTIKDHLTAIGSQLSPQQESVLRAKIEADLEPKDEESAPASAVTPEMKSQADFVYAQIDATFADVGMTVLPTDPEFKAIKEVLDDPNGSLPRLIRVTGKQAEAKVARVALQKKNAAARVLGGGESQTNSNSISGITDITTLYEMGDRAIREKK